MSVIVLLIVAGGAVAVGFLVAFLWAVRSGQFDDTCTPAIRMLFDQEIGSADAAPPHTRAAGVDRGSTAAVSPRAR